MTQRKITIGLFLLLFGFTACVPHGIEEAQVDFCQALDAYGEALQTLQDVDAGTTVDELRAARKDVEAARQNVVSTAEDLRGARLRHMEQVWNDAQAQIDAVPGGTTLGEASAAIRGQALALGTEIERVNNMSCHRR